VRQQRGTQRSYQAWNALRCGDRAGARRHSWRALRESRRMGRLGWISLVLAHSPRPVGRCALRLRDALRNEARVSSGVR
jgi:hypothetical protein